MKRQFIVGDGEFGEVYHLLVSAYLLQLRDEKIGICFKNFPSGKELFRFLSIPTVKYNPLSRRHPLPSTADIILDNYSLSCIEPLASILRDVANDKSWSFPSSQLFNQLKTQSPKIVIWQRNSNYKEHRNSSVDLLHQIISLCSLHETTPVILGPNQGIAGAIELDAFYEHPFFKSGDSIPKQLWFLDKLFHSFNVVAQVGMMSGAMDGPAMLLGHKTLFLARGSDAKPRMEKVSSVVPSLIWQQIEYKGTFQKLTDAQLKELERNLWG